MNAKWSLQNKKFQADIKHKQTFKEGISDLLVLRKELLNHMLIWKNELDREDYSLQPFIDSKGYESKTIAYSIYHVFRIEDIVCNVLMCNKKDILTSENYIIRMNTPIITTGNELKLDEISRFSEELNIDELYHYVYEVYAKTNYVLENLSFEDLKFKFNENDKKRVLSEKFVDTSAEAVWLVDYWCDSNVLHLLKMPFSRHWIMHFEAIDRIIKKIKK